MSIYGVIGFIFSITGWLLLIFAIMRNQRVAAKSPLVETSNFGPRLGAIIETSLHPDHAVNWWRPATKTESQLIRDEKYIGEWAEAVVRESEYIVLVFPTLGKDSSEIHGIRLDDGNVT